ncbi:MAG TPA: stalk domain-containing protein [Armatimonadota bacterium]|nr:stalk domain-containing protein [Armatimonadota bacterium]
MPRFSRFIASATLTGAVAAMSFGLSPFVAAAAAASSEDAASLAAASASTKTITVIVNGQPASDLGHAPVIRNGSMLIPLNGILDRLAATVSWQPLTKTADIQRGATHLQLMAGSLEARVNGTAQEMDAAPEVLGDTLMVPMRFVTDELGLTHSWNAATRQLSVGPGAIPMSHSAGPATGSPLSAGAIITPAAAGVPATSNVNRPAAGSESSDTTAAGPGVDSGSVIPAPPANDSTSTVAPAPGGDGGALLPPVLPPTANGGAIPGTTVPSTGSTPPALPSNPAIAPVPEPAPAAAVTGELDNITQKDGATVLEVSAAGTLTQYNVAEGAAVYAREATQLTRQEIELSGVYPGDEVTLHLNDRQQVSSIETSYRSIQEKIQAVAGDKLLLSSGEVLNVSPRVTVTGNAGTPGALADLTPGTLVTLRINPVTNLVWRIDASRRYVGEAGAAALTPSVGNLKIKALDVQAAGPYRAGDAVVVTMEGTPGAAADITVPGVPGQTTLKEYDPGVYKGTLVVPPGLSVIAAPVVGHLSLGPDRAVLAAQSAQAVTIDSAAPVVEQMAPGDNASVTNHKSAIYAVFDDHGGTGVDPASVRLHLNGVDVTGQAQITDRFISCTGIPLPDGVNHVLVSARDKVGNAVEKPWDFTVRSLSNPIHSVDAHLGRSKGSEEVRITLEGRAGGEATFDLADWRDQPMKETHPGRYEGVLRLERGDQVKGLPVIGHLKIGDRASTMLSKDLVTYLDTRPAAPVIEGPVTGSEIESPLVVFGHADPGCTVHVKVEFNNRVLSVFGLRGISSQQNAIVDDTGAWRTEQLGLGTFIPGHPKHLTYQIICESVNAMGTLSKKSEITVYRDAH